MALSAGTKMKNPSGGGSGISELTENLWATEDVFTIYISSPTVKRQMGDFLQRRKWRHGIVTDFFQRDDIRSRRDFLQFATEDNSLHNATKIEKA